MKNILCENIGPAKVYKNLLEKKEFERIKEGFLAPEIPWSYNQTIADTAIDTFQFVLLIFKDDKILSQIGFELIEPVLRKIDPAMILRLKVNLRPKCFEHFIGGFHVDTGQECTTSIFYLNTNNGYTEFEDGSKIPSIENTLVSFDSSVRHTGVGQTDEEVRLVLNMNYISKE